jgi:putative flavoprotein involved in K+ transport
MFQFPHWSLRLPGQEYCGDDPDGFASREEVIAFIERYREAVDAPVRTGVRVDRVAPIDGGFRLETTEGPIEAAHVVIATGPYQEPLLPAVRHALPPSVVQVHASGYRNPVAPAGGCRRLRRSGCQIAEDLLAGPDRVPRWARHRRIPPPRPRCSGGWSDRRARSDARRAPRGSGNPS